MIVVSDLSKSFGKLQVLQSVNASFDLGDSCALVGPNGSGKTTLVKCILGLTIPDKGSIAVAGDPIKSRWSYRKRIGYMPQIGRFPEQMRIGQLFDMMSDLRHDVRQKDEDLVRAFGLDQLRDKRMHTLSGGTRQKVSASLAFLFHPEVLILDEPTAGLDPVAVEILKEKILLERRNNKALIITSHVMSDLDDLCSSLLYLEEGRVRYDDSIENLKEDTGEARLGRAVAAIMTRTGKPATETV